MIPEFPQLKPIELSDKEEIEKITHKYPPYSDFNFLSMWSWNIHSKMLISLLNGNLVVLFTDYISGEHFFSFMGENKIPETISELLEFSEKHYHTNYLKLIPEEIVNLLPEKIFKAETDRDSYDYIYSVTHLANMDHWSKNSSGKRVRKFIRSNPTYSIRQLSPSDIPREEYVGMFKKWAQNKHIENHFELNEYKAFERFLEVHSKNLKLVSLYVDDVLVGFTGYEILSNDFAMSHFAKADHAHESAISDILNWQEAKILNERGVTYFNWEQDLGIPGLRYSKEKYKHSFFLKKFVVRKIS